MEIEKYKKAELLKSIHKDNAKLKSINKTLEQEIDRLKLNNKKKEIILQEIDRLKLNNKKKEIILQELEHYNQKNGLE